MLAELERSNRAPAAFAGRSRVIALVIVAAILWAAVWVLGPMAVQALRPAPRVDVNFITDPFEASIYLDGEPLLAADGTPYRTPCTVPNLPAKKQRVVFRREGADDLDLGVVDLAESREVEGRWRSPADR